MYSIKREPLASRWDDRRPDGYDVVIVGSGYGGAVTAARLATAVWPAGAKPTVCILERGREWLPGQFPDSLGRGLQEARGPLNPLGIYDTNFSTDIGIIMGSGLGGTSLVNANIAIRPDREVFEQDRWPEAVREASQAGGLDAYFDRVRMTLFAGPHPEGLSLSKVKALKRGAEGLANATFGLHDIVVNFRFEGRNHWGVQQRKCINCGDCVTGCNVGAKNTLDTNYLAIAKSGGAEIFTQVEVKRVTPEAGGGYLVHYLWRESAHGEAEEGALRAKRVVVLAAGSLGSTGILLRSRAAGLDLPDSVGARFGGNGDFFGLAYNSDLRTDTLGWGAYPESDRARRMQPADGRLLNPGPTIVSRIRYDTGGPLRERVKSEDLSLPRMYVDAARTALAFAVGRDTDPRDVRDNFEELGRRFLDIGGADPRLEKGALNYSLAYLVNGHDDAGGRVELDPATDEPRVKWPGVGGQEFFRRANQLLLEHAAALGATYVENPLWGFLPFRTLVTAHPLGGCAMSDSHATGVVNHVGQVYNPQGGIYDGLRVADGAIIPTSLGVNPFLTISALAERAAEQLVGELGGTPAVLERI